ncbi:hypothetical protein M595_0775 [Lyngbya aestuarii BL J]|uniref:Uncharacterized protein n=1 Tax=Lyngbya aestuarii BL J TaxID=1348334 RepID=U7QPZ0_9CYAN|nr:hypothetical protein M595_0775 [Lyngbya aestuarii BL J]
MLGDLSKTRALPLAKLCQEMLNVNAIIRVLASILTSRY